MRYLLGGLWNPEVGIQRSGPTSYANDSMQAVSDERAIQVAAVFRCIRIIAETAASLPIKALQRTSRTADPTPLPDSHWFQGILEEPNPEMFGAEWREAMFAQMAGWGNGYSEMARNSEDRAVELWPLKSGRMEVSRKPDKSLEYRYPDVNGLPQILQKSKVFHARLFSVDGVMGLSPLALARESLGLAIGAERFAASFFAQGGRPSGVMTSDKLLNDKQRDQIEKKFGGLAKGGTDERFWLLEGPLKYQAVSANPEDMQLLATRSFQLADIARWFGVPLFLLMETEKSTAWGTGLEQFLLAFLTFTLRPYLERMECVLNYRVVPPEERGRVFCEIDETALLRADSQAQQSFFSAMVNNGILTRNEVRRRLKYPAKVGADELTAQTALAPLSALGRLASQTPPNSQPTQRALGAPDEPGLRH